MSRCKGKGSAFEREISRQLSLWWSAGMGKKSRDDIFWRATTSGARATTRLKKNKRTAGAHGDITATDPIGKPFMDCVTIECKRGYKNTTAGELLDKPPKGAMGQFEKWLAQAHEAWLACGSYSWLLITKRNGRDAIVTFPKGLLYAIEDAVKHLGIGKQNCPVVAFIHIIIWHTNKLPASTGNIGLCIMPLSEFLKFDPRIFVEISKM